jgi:5-methylcytosine-specific restriction endonuclease McrA
MSCVFVLDAEKRPLNPVHPGTARWLLDHRKAAVWRRYPFTIILKRAVLDATPESLRVKIDPGSRTTGLAVVDDATGQVVWAGELQHRGQRIREALQARRALRSNRRQRHTRYRPARFANWTRPEGWLPPSLGSRLSHVLTWVARLRRSAPITALSQELVRFDTQLLETPEISGPEYQQGELAGYEVRQYLLEKFQRRCAYCGATGLPLQIEHVVPKARGGTDRVSNLTIACERCNAAKGTWTASEFGHPEVQAQGQRPLKDAAAVNASRWALFQRLRATGLPVEVGTGGRTKWNRSRQGLPKTHWIDAACVGASTPEQMRMAGVRPLSITATGHGHRQMCGTNKHGFPIRHRARQKRFFGFQTGDMVRPSCRAPSRLGDDTLGGCWCAPVAALIWRPSPGECKASAIAIVRQSLAAMVTPTPMEQGRATLPPRHA